MSRLDARVPRTIGRHAHGAQDLAIYALGLIGVDYRFGGTTPDRGLDCSGLVRYVFQQVTGVTLPRTSQELSRLGTKVPWGTAFFSNTASSVASAAASEGITAIAPLALCSSPPCNH